MGTPVGFVGGPCETVEIGTGHESIMPEPRGDDAGKATLADGTLSRASPAAARMTRLATAAVTQAMGRDLAEPDWWRLLDALMLVAAHPAAS